jgi:hypothetical protein
MKKTSALALDVAGLIGAALISYGAWMIYRPAGLILAGAMLITAALLMPRE